MNDDLELKDDLEEELEGGLDDHDLLSPKGKKGLHDEFGFDEDDLALDDEDPLFGDDFSFRDDEDFG